MAPPGCMCGFLLLSALLLQAASAAADADGKQQMVEEMNNVGKLDDTDISSSIRQNFNPDTPPVHRSLPPSILLQLLLSRNFPHQQPPVPPQQQYRVDGNSDDDDDENTDVVKRVFCNAFTGCGGRHRRRRRLLKKRLILVKRPICNSFGCLPVGTDPVAFNRARLLAQDFAAAAAAGGEKQASTGVTSGKRLFCNGYGGCRGGKRSLFSPWMNKMNSVAEGRR